MACAKRAGHSPPRYGRAQPLGHPVMRITMESFRNPFSSHTFSTFPIRTGRYLIKVTCQGQGVKRNGLHTRSDSAMASPDTGRTPYVNVTLGYDQWRGNIPHVGNATQADDDSLKPL